jgi:predicted ATP-dependent Lon-type protease
MNIADDKSLSREAAFGAIVFYYAERARHMKDVSLIDQCIDKLTLRNDFNLQDLKDAETFSRKYVDF